MIVEKLSAGDVIGTSPQMTVTGVPVVGPIPSFNVQEAVVVPVDVEYGDTTIETVVAFRPGQEIGVLRRADQ